MKNQLRWLLAAVVAALAFWALQERPVEAAFGGGGVPPLGKSCTVQFRRGDALGGAGNLPVNPTTGSINGAEVAVSGTLRSVTSEWLSVEAPNKTMLWIPKESVLLIQVGD